MKIERKLVTLPLKGMPLTVLAQYLTDEKCVKLLNSLVRDLTFNHVKLESVNANLYPEFNCSGNYCVQVTNTFDEYYRDIVEITISVTTLEYFVK